MGAMGHMILYLLGVVTTEGIIFMGTRLEATAVGSMGVAVMVGAGAGKSGGGAARALGFAQCGIFGLARGGGFA